MPAALAWTYPTINAMTRWLHDNASFADASVGKKGLLKATLGAAALTYAVRFRPLTQPRVRFFCFHGAGGSPEAFAKWRTSVPADVEVLGIWHLRHRDGETAPALKYLEDTVSLIQRDADVPYVLIGLSLGGAFAWRVAKELVRRRERSNLRGICAVATPLNSRTRGRSDEQEMMRTLHEQRAPGYEKALEQIRADVYKDLDLVDAIGWPAESNEALPIPIIAFAGLSDEEAPPAAIQRWRSLTTAAFHLYVSPGDHLAGGQCERRGQPSENPLASRRVAVGPLTLWDHIQPTC